MMSDESRANWNAYQRQWKADNPEKVKEYQRRYAIKRALKALPTEEQQRAYLNQLEKSKQPTESERKAKRKAKDENYFIRKGLSLLQQEQMSGGDYR